MSEENTQEKHGEKITVNLTDNTRDAAIGIYVEKNLRKESVSVYHDYIDEGETPTQALARAVINEMVILACVDRIAREKFEKELKEE